MTTTLNNIELPFAIFVNEFENSATSHEEKYTEDGKKIIFQQQKQHTLNPVLNCGWMAYSDLNTLKTVRDNGQPVSLLLKSGKSLMVLVKEIKGTPIIEYTDYNPDDFFDVTLTLIEI